MFCIYCVLYVAPPSLPPPPPSPASSSLLSIVSWWVYPVARPAGRLMVSLFMLRVRLLVVIIAVALWLAVVLAGHIMCGGDGVTGSPALTDTTPHHTTTGSGYWWYTVRHSAVLEPLHDTLPSTLQPTHRGKVNVHQQ